MEENKIFEKRWLLAKNDQRERYLKLINKYPDIRWTDKEKVYLLWLCNLDIDTLDAFEGIFDKLQK